MALTQNQILDLAPDASSRKSGQDLGQARKWSVLGRDDRIAWGEIKGSGASPYRTAAELDGASSKCSCPSRKFPCKHGLGLLLSHAASPGDFPVSEMPDWVAKWVQGRDVRSGKAEAPEAKPVDEAGRAKRSKARGGKVREGAAELDLWLRDMLRRGLASVRAEPYAFYDRMAARLVDAQAPGLAQAVRRLSAHAAGEAWPGFTVDETLALAVARLGTAARGLQHDGLADEAAATLQELAGVPVPSDRIAEIPPVRDAWAVLGVRIEAEGKLMRRQTWLAGAGSSGIASIVDYGRPLGPGPLPGMDFEGEVRFLPGSSGRAVIGERTASGAAWPVGMSILQALDRFADALAATPWCESVPVHVADVRLGHAGGASVLSDGSHAMPLAAGGRREAFEAASAGRPCSVFGLWNGRTLVPLSLSRDGRRYAAGPDASGIDLARVA